MSSTDEIAVIAQRAREALAQVDQSLLNWSHTPIVPLANDVLALLEERGRLWAQNEALLKRERQLEEERERLMLRLRAAEYVCRVEVAWQKHELGDPPPENIQTSLRAWQKLVTDLAALDPQPEKETKT